MVAVQGAKRTILWSDNNISTLLEALHARESLWNSKEVVYRDKNVRKREYEDILALLREDMPNINLPAVKGTIFFCPGWKIVQFD